MLKFKDLSNNEMITINITDVQFITHQKDYILIIKNDYTEYTTKTIMFV